MAAGRLNMTHRTTVAVSALVAGVCVALLARSALADDAMKRVCRERAWTAKNRCPESADDATEACAEEASKTKSGCAVAAASAANACASKPDDTRKACKATAVATQKTCNDNADSTKQACDKKAVDGLDVCNAAADTEELVCASKLSILQAPLTQPGGTLAVSVTLAAEHRSSPDDFPRPSTDFGFSPALRIGFATNFDAELRVLPVIVAPVARYGNPIAQTTYRFVHRRSVEFGIRAAGQIIPSENAARFDLRLPLVLRGSALRFEMELAGLVVGRLSSLSRRSSEGETRPAWEAGKTFGLQIPIHFTFSPGGWAHFGLDTGIGVNDYGTAGDVGLRLDNYEAIPTKTTLIVPAGLRLGLFSRLDGTILDLSSYVILPRFITVADDKDDPRTLRWDIAGGLTATLVVAPE